MCLFPHVFISICQVAGHFSQKSHYFHMCLFQYVTAIHCNTLQGGEDQQDALSCRSFFAKEPLIIGLFCGKWPIKIRHSLGLRHPVMSSFISIYCIMFNILYCGLTSIICLSIYLRCIHLSIYILLHPYMYLFTHTQTHKKSTQSHTHHACAHTQYIVLWPHVNHVWMSKYHCNTLQHTTGWRRPTGHLKLQVIFRKRATILYWPHVNHLSI